MSKRLSKKDKRKINNFVLKHWKFFLVMILLVVGLFVMAYYFGWLDILFKGDEDKSLSTAGGYVTEVTEFGELQVNFLQVGQADCIVIELPDSKVMMIDTGDSSSDQSVITKFFEENNIKAIDYLLITHSDSDHVGNADWVLNNYVVRYIFRPSVYSDNSLSAEIPSTFNVKSTIDGTYVCASNVYARFIVSAYNEGCTTEFFNKDSDFSNTLKCGEEEMKYTFNFLTPTASREEISYGDANNFSPIMMLEYGGRRVMFNGDAELENLNEYVTTYGSEYNVDVLKVGHHGSRNATTLEYINAIDPEYAVIQNGLHKTFQHPHQETLDILTGHENGVEIYRTDNNGNITLTISYGGNMSWQFDSDDMSKNLYNGTKMLELAENALNLDNFNRDTDNNLTKITHYYIFEDSERRKFALVA